MFLLGHPIQTKGAFSSFSHFILRLLKELPFWKILLVWISLETVVCGLPIVSTKAGGVVDIVFNDVNGYICESFEPEEYASYIEKIIIDKELRFRMKKESRKFVEKLSVKNCAKNYEEIYES